MPLEATIAVGLFSETIGTAAAVAIVVEGGVYMLHHGNAYITETVSHMVDIAQGTIIGLKTEYDVNVLSDGTATIQVFSGPVVFIDPITNNTVTVGTDQMLTLPPVRPNGFTTQDLLNDVSTFTPDSVNQWWTQASPSSSTSFLDEPLIVVALVIAITLGISVPIVTISKRGKKEQFKR